jgi:hypothetical protein
MLTTPPPPRHIGSRASCVASIAPRRFTSRVACHWSGLEVTSAWTKRALLPCISIACTVSWPACGQHRLRRARHRPRVGAESRVRYPRQLRSLERRVHEPPSGHLRSAFPLLPATTPQDLEVYSRNLATKAETHRTLDHYAETRLNEVRCYRRHQPRACPAPATTPGCPRPPMPPGSSHRRRGRAPRPPTRRAHRSVRYP